MKIEILGTGCYNCVRLESLVDEVLQALGTSNVEVFASVMRESSGSI